ncbi:DedA family protein [Synechocystis sp. PCC 7509]|uniref:DedA family protein n=1 Tax=Synechocystis sp. PCC 7509 TaxID=927677 RepID=UPI0002AC24A3|nr:DedA family protein [Synechocystis sp. PCC 7509]
MSAEFLSLETIQAIAQHYGYWAVFGGILLENLGIPLPGETVTLVGGFLAGSGQLNYWFVLSSAILGAVIGGTCGYWIGRYAGWTFMLKLGKLLRIPETKLEEIKAQFTENAGKAVFFGRFIALLRVFSGLLAGIAQMPFGQFFLYNLVGAIAWASVMVTLAFFVGRVIALEQLIAWVGQFTLVAFGLVISWLFIPPWLEARKTNKELKSGE